MLTRSSNWKEDLKGDLQDLQLIWVRFRDEIWPIITDFILTPQQRWRKQHSGYVPYLNREAEGRLPRMPTREEWVLLRKYFPADGKQGADPTQLTIEENRILVNYLEGAAEIRTAYNGYVADKHAAPWDDFLSKQADLFKQRFNQIANPNMLVTNRVPGERAWVFPLPTKVEVVKAMEKAS